MAKFKVGDRARRIKRSNGDGMDVGTEWVVAGFKKYLSDDYLVFEGGRNGNAENFEPVAVAPATATLKIEAGKFYKTRDGRKVGPAFVDGSIATFGWKGDHTSAVWAKNGRGSANSDTTTELAKDIVAEWVDEPVAPAPTAPATPTHLDLEFIPFPQVGDAVLIPGVISGITNSARGTNYNIVFETQNRRMSLHFLEEDFIVDPEQGDGDCPCANDNGPAPSTDTAKAFDAMGAWLRSLAVSRAA